MNEYRISHIYYKSTKTVPQGKRCSSLSDAQFIMWRIPMSSNWAVIPSSSVTLDHDARALPPASDFRKGDRRTRPENNDTTHP